MIVTFNGWFETVSDAYQYCSNCSNSILPGRKAYIRIDINESMIKDAEVMCEKCMMAKYPMLFVMGSDGHYAFLME